MLRTTGIHHITAIASDPQANLDFYTGVLGLRFIKRTVNFDDPGTYHFYFGDEGGTPGTILTFFPWPHAKRGTAGAGSVSAVGFAVPAGTLAAWEARLAAAEVEGLERFERFGRVGLAFADPDGMRLELVEDDAVAAVAPWAPAGGPPAAEAIRGFHHATILVRSGERMDKVLAAAFGMTVEARDGNHRRYRAAGDARIGLRVDVLEDPSAAMVRPGAGVVHHIAMRAADRAEQARWAERMMAAGLRPTPTVDRNYFHSIYFREPQGVLFEIATDGPGFSVDEPTGELGRALKLPAQYEPRRREIEAHLPKVHLPGEGPTGDLALHRHVFEAGEGTALLLLHGTGGDEHDLMDLGRKVAPKAPLLSPRGNVSEQGQNRFFRRFGEGVFDLKDVAERTAELTRWLRAAEGAYGIGTPDVLGFSNGANTAAAALLTQGPVFRRVVLLRAMVTVPEAGLDLKGVEVLLVSGARDPIVPVENARRLARQLTEAGATVRHEVLASGHELTGEDLALARGFLGR